MFASYDRLLKILADCTVLYRKGDELRTELRAGLEVMQVYAMPPLNQAEPGLTLIDVHFMVVGVRPEKAEERRSDFVSILETFDPNIDLTAGPGYIPLSYALESQRLAMQFIALGSALGLWEMITPERLGFEGEAADKLAGEGWVMMSGWTPKTAQAA